MALLRASPENERAASNEEADVSPKLEYDNDSETGKSDMYNPTRSSDHIEASTAQPKNTTPGMLAGFCQSL